MTLYDENAAVLRRFEENGSDLNASRTVDFSYIFQTEISAAAFADQARKLGFETDIEFHASEDHADAPWDVTTSREMVPNCENITAAELQLNVVAEACSGQSDGWGFFRN